jgi:hypothetical protein
MPKDETSSLGGGGKVAESVVTTTLSVFAQNKKLDHATTNALRVSLGLTDLNASVAEADLSRGLLSLLSPKGDS